MRVELLSYKIYTFYPQNTYAQAIHFLGDLCMQKTLFWEKIN